MTNQNTELDKILYMFEQRSNKARMEVGTGIPLTTRLLKEKREATEAIQALYAPKPVENGELTKEQPNEPI